MGKLWRNHVHPIKTPNNLFCNNLKLDFVWAIPILEFFFHAVLVAVIGIVILLHHNPVWSTSRMDGPNHH